MKIDLKFQWPEKREWFSAGDRVHGCVIVDLPRPESIRSIVVSLTGALQSS